MTFAEFCRLLIADPGQLVSRARRSDVARRIEDTIYRPRGGRFAKTPVNLKEICVLGMRRSGNHAVIHWLEMMAAQGPGTVVHLNNLAPGENGYRHRLWYPEPLSADQRDIFCRGRRKRLDAGEIGLLIRSYEDIAFDSFAQDHARPFYYGGAEARISLLVARDPANLFASRLRSGFTETRVPGMGQVALYLDMLRKARTSPGTIIVKFNDFVRSAAYRRALLDKMGFKAEDRDPTAKVSGYGGGSSFNDDAVSADALTARYVNMLDDPEFRAILQDPRIVAEFEKLFPAEFSEFSQRLKTG